MIRETVAHEHDYLHKLCRGIAANGDLAIAGKRSIMPKQGSVDAIAVWGWRQGSIYRDRGFNVICCERGYVGDRFLWTSLGLNGLNGRATFPDAQDEGERWERYFGNLMQPWRYRQDGYALIMGQVPHDTAVRGISFPSWVAEMRTAAERKYGRVKFRAHPQASPSISLRGDTLGSLADDLAGAAIAVTYNSNSGVDAILAGVPTVAMDAGSMVRAVAAHSLDEDPMRPDRSAWARRIAWAQWLPKELESGEAWSRLRTLI